MNEATPTVTCVTCKQVLTGGRCTNELCPGFEAREDEDLQARNTALLAALGQIRDKTHGAANVYGPLPSLAGTVYGIAAGALLDDENEQARRALAGEPGEGD